MVVFPIVYGAWSISACYYNVEYCYMILHVLSVSVPFSLKKNICIHIFVLYFFLVKLCLIVIQ